MFLRKLHPLFNAVPRCNLNLVNTIKRTTAGRSIFEPDYLESLQPEYPQYESINVQIKGYDYPILESYQSYLHSIADYLDIDVADSYAMPAQKMCVQKLKPSSTVVDAEYQLNVYQRNIKLVDVNAPIYPMFLRIAQAALPEGVELTMQEHTHEVEESRYVPDFGLKELQVELEKMQTKT